MKAAIQAAFAEQEAELHRFLKEGNDHGNEPRKHLTKSLNLRVAALSHLLEAVECYQESATYAAIHEVLSCELLSIKNEMTGFFGSENTAQLLKDLP